MTIQFITTLHYYMVGLGLFTLLLIIGLLVSDYYDMKAEKEWKENRP